MMMRLLWLILLLGASVSTAHGEGANFQTDEVVRAEMKAIRDLTLNVHTLVTHRRMPQADARSFHARVGAAIERIEAGTTLQGAARDEIAAIAKTILGGAAAVSGADPAITPIDGIIAIDEALALYAKRFDHPDWQPLR